MKNQFITCCRKALVVGAAVGLCTAVFMGVAVAADKDSGGRKLAKSTKKYTDAPFSVDSLVGTLKFQFEPVLATDKYKYVPTDFYHNTKSPIWMLTNMGTPMFFDTTAFKISEMKSSAEGWTIKSAVPDDIYGSIDVVFDIKKSGKTQLKISTASDVLQNYSGDLFPYERSYVFESEKVAKQAAKNQKQIDPLAASVTFRIYAASGIRGFKLESVNYSEVIDQRYRDRYRVKINFAEKINEFWYIRTEYEGYGGHKDYCINVFNGEVYSRGGDSDTLFLAWRFWSEGVGFIAPA